MNAVRHPNVLAVTLVLMLGVVLGFVTAASPLIAVAVVVSLGLLFAVLIAPTSIVVPVLLTLALAASRFRVHLGDVTVGLDQAAMGSLLLLALLRLPRVREPYTVLVVAYLAIGSLALLLSGYGIEAVARAFLLLGIAASGYWVAGQLGATPRALERCAKTIEAVAIFEALLAVGGLALHLLGGTDIGVQIEAGTGLPKAYGTFFEANLLGAFLAAALVLVFVDGSRVVRRGRGNVVVPALLSAGLLCTLTRAAWVGACIGALGAVLLARSARGSRFGHVGRVAGSAALAFITLIVLVAPARTLLVDRIGDVLDMQHGSGFGRGEINKLALAEWDQAPWIGKGFLSFSQKLPQQIAPGWIPAFHVAVLHDAGIVGAVTVAALLALILRKVLRRRGPPLAHAFGLAVVALVVASLATQSQTLPMFWLIMGMAAAAGTRGLLSRGERDDALPALVS